ncbi:MAG: PD-(D/E)XK nuclease domain-containing protein [Rectinemataceae bacterium]
MRTWYKGYKFHHSSQTLYNPVSVMKCFMEQEFKNYWFETGTPGFLIQLLKRQPIKLGDLSAGEELFSTYDPTNLEPLALLMQTGYLTIKSAETFGDLASYHLGYPNKEIEHSFSHWLAQGFSELPSADMTPLLHRLVAALRESRLEDLLETFRLFFAKIPNTITLDHEKYYQTIFFTVFKLIGAVVEVEVSTNIGRIDAIVKTTTDIFVFEFKLGGASRWWVRLFRKKPGTWGNSW